ncbi:MAG: hypothetical protein RLZZ338_4008 [Cyanobacteriota bacterium]|jgi:hypothetical protein
MFSLREIFDRNKDVIFFYFYGIMPSRGNHRDFTKKTVVGWRSLCGASDVSLPRFLPTVREVCVSEPTTYLPKLDAPLFIFFLLILSLMCIYPDRGLLYH